MKEKILRNWARFATRHPVWVIAIILVLAVLSIIAASSRLELTMQYSDMLPQGDPLAEEFDRILNEYKSASNSIIVIQGREKNIKDFADELVPKIESLKTYVVRVDYKIDKDFISRHGFMLSRTRDLKDSRKTFEDLSLIPFITNLNDNFEKEYIGDEEALSTREKEDEAVRSLDGLQYWIETMNRFIEEGNNAGKILADSAVDRFLFGDPYLISQDKRTLLVMVKPTFNAIEIEKCVASTDSIQTIVDRTLEDYPDVRAGLTGTIPIQHDEMKYTTKDMKNSFIIAIVLILLLFVLTFRMWSSPILAALNLILAIIIASGIISFIPGRLNAMTAMFAVILVGLGIDYSIHIISVYSERRVINGDATSAMEETFIRSGSGIITGGLTTTIAFFALMVSTTRGIKEMGIVLGIGILSAMFTTLAGLPAFLVIREKVAAFFGKENPKPANVEFTALESYGKRLMKRPVLFLVIAVVLTGFFMFQASRVQFDYNFLNLEPKGMKSIALHDTIIEVFDMSPDFAMITTETIEESWRISRKAREMPSVSNVDNIADYCPPESLQMERQPLVRDIRDRISSDVNRLPVNSSNLKKLTEQLERLDMNIYELSQMVFIGGQDRVDKKARSIIGEPEAENPNNMILSLVNKIRENPQRAITAMNRFQNYYEPELRNKAYQMANPEIIRLEEVPKHIKNRYFNDKRDKFLVTMNARGAIWDLKLLENFTEQLKRINPEITGTPQIMLRLIRCIGRDGMRAIIIAVIVVFLLLLLDFRSLKIALLGLIPLIAGGIWMIGLLKTFGMKLTMINVTGIPMIIGIGIDDAVHLLHRYRIEGMNKTPLVLKSTGKAILLTTLTTMVGFGSLMIARYRGFIGLGAILVMGVAACFITTVMYLPSIIAIAQKSMDKKRE